MTVTEEDKGQALMSLNGKLVELNVPRSSRHLHYATLGLKMPVDCVTGGREM